MGEVCSTLIGDGGAFSEAGRVAFVRRIHARSNGGQCACKCASIENCTFVFGAPLPMLQSRVQPNRARQAKDPQQSDGTQRQMIRYLAGYR